MQETDMPKWEPMEDAQRAQYLLNREYTLNYSRIALRAELHVKDLLWTHTCTAEILCNADCEAAAAP